MRASNDFRILKPLDLQLPMSRGIRSRPHFSPKQEAPIELDKPKIATVHGAPNQLFHIASKVFKHFLYLFPYSR